MLWPWPGPTPRFYLDADVLGLAKTLAALRADLTYPGDLGATVRQRVRPPRPITSPAIKDPDWIPQVTHHGWLIITRDRHIQEHRAEINAVRTHRARMVVLTGADAVDTWHQLEVVLCRWRDIEACLNQPGPFIYTATRTTLHEIPL